MAITPPQVSSHPPLLTTYTSEDYFPLPHILSYPPAFVPLSHMLPMVPPPGKPEYMAPRISRFSTVVLPPTGLV